MDEDEAPAIERPQTRGECARGPRPCPWVSCHYHLADPTESRRGALLMFGSKLPRDADAAEVEQVTEALAESVVSMRETCALDVADRERDGATLESIGEALAVTRERVRQIEMRAVRALRLSPRTRPVR